MSLHISCANWQKVVEFVRGTSFAWAATALVAILTLGCGEKSKEAPRKPQPELAQVSVMAEIMRKSASFQRQVSCALMDSTKSSDRQSEETSRSDYVEQLFTKMQADRAFRRSFFGEVEVATKPTFDVIVTSKAIPDVVYAFAMFEPCCNEASEEAYGIQEVGLFLNLEECNYFEQVVRDQGIPTRKCDQWYDSLARMKARLKSPEE